MKEEFKIVIMAGGDGNRFYPYSTAYVPKQFLNFVGNKSLLQQTYERALQLTSKGDIFISTQYKYMPLIKQQIPDFNIKRILVEPLKKNTAMSIAYCTCMIHNLLGKRNIIFMPSDHYIEDADSYCCNRQSSYCDTIQKACELADQNLLVTNIN